MSYGAGGVTPFPSLHVVSPATPSFTSSLSPSPRPSDAFHRVPGITSSLEQLAIQARPTSQKRRLEAKVFYPVSYIRTEWMQQLLDLGCSKRKVRFFLSDETLCLGTSEAPITSEYQRPLIFHEAYLINGTPATAQIYMTDYQVDWLVDEIYTNASGAVDDSKMEIDNFEVDKKKAVKRTDFGAIRKICFAKNVASFRSKCGLASINVAPKKTSSPVAAKSPSFPATSTVASKKAALQQSEMSDVSQSPSLLTSAAITSTLSLPSVRPSSSPVKTPMPSPPKPTSFQSLNRSERQLRQLALREESLKQHISQQQENFPRAQRLYQQMKKHGGTAMACDVESWTEDADVLLELGISWYRWSPEQVKGSQRRESGNSHYIIEENVQYRNIELDSTRWDYNLGQSKILPQSEVANRLGIMIEEMSAQGPLILIFHDASAECRYFQKLGIDPSNYLTNIPRDLLQEPPLHWPSRNSGTDILIQDTQNLFCGWSQPPVKQINLGKACALLGIEATKLHNAGNDAAATLEFWEKLLEMGESAVRQGK